LASILWLEIITLAAFLALGVMGQPFTDPDGWQTVVAAMAGAMAMGMQNTAARLHLAKLPPSTMMTGNVTQIGIDALDLLFGRTPMATRDPIKNRLARNAWTVLWFVIGALLGALAALKTGFWGLIAPIAALSVLALSLASSAAIAPVPNPNPNE
jgi:uncharacterized membrane protein YoaK (UPF0700 family)